MHFKDMGSGDWFKAIITRKNTKQDRLKKIKGATIEQSNGFKSRNQSHIGSYKFYNVTANRNTGNSGMSIEDIAATWIQTAFRRYRARKTLRHLKGVKRLQSFTHGNYVRKQASNTLSYLHSWGRIQAQIRARRASMVTEGHIRQKKQDNQLKLEAKLHDIEVEWCGGVDTMEDILSRIQQREEASIKRERALAYAFSHQWRANSGLNQGYEFGKGIRGWSWMERWIAARPWEARAPVQLMSPNKAKSNPTNKVGKAKETSARGVSDPIKFTVFDARGPTKRASQPTEEKIAIQKSNSKPAAPAHPKTKNGKMKQETEVPPNPSKTATVYSYGVV